MTPRRPKRQGEASLSDAIREALALEGVEVLRNAQCAVRKSNRMVRGGLGNGSADLVCIVPVRIVIVPQRDTAQLPAVTPFGRAAFLEVKVPGKVPTAETIARITAKSAPDLDKDDERDLAQWNFLERMRKAGAFAAYVSSVAEARAAIARARTGATS